MAALRSETAEIKIAYGRWQGPAGRLAKCRARESSGLQTLDAHAAEHWVISRRRGVSFLLSDLS
jgi:hypothetical protein